MLNSWKVWLAADGAALAPPGLGRRAEAGAAADAQDGAGADRAPGVPVPAAGSRHRAAESRLLDLVAIMDWASRKVLAWRLSNTMDADFCVAALEDALARYGRPVIFNTDQGSQFTSLAFTDVLTAAGGRISMDPLDRQRLH
jgi:transposase InsO family protein